MILLLVVVIVFAVAEVVWVIRSYRRERPRKQRLWLLSHVFGARTVARMSGLNVMSETGHRWNATDEKALRYLLANTDFPPDAAGISITFGDAT